MPMGGKREVMWGEGGERFEATHGSEMLEIVFCMAVFIRSNTCTMGIWLKPMLESMACHSSARPLTEATAHWLTAYQK